MFNSPLAWCPIVRAYVALDEPNHACRAEHRCATGDCPLKGLFASAALVVHEATSKMQKVRAEIGKSSRQRLLAAQAVDPMLVAGDTSSGGSCVAQAKGE